MKLMKDTSHASSVQTCRSSCEEKRRHDKKQKQFGSHRHRRRRNNNESSDMNGTNNIDGDCYGSASGMKMNSIFSSLSNKCSTSPSTPPKENNNPDNNSMRRERSNHSASIKVPKTHVPHLKKSKSPRSVIDRLDSPDEDNNHEDHCTGEEAFSCTIETASTSQCRLNQVNPQNTKQHCKPLLQIIKLNNQGVDAFKSQRFDFAMKLFLVAHKQCISFLQRESSNSVETFISSLSINQQEFHDDCDTINTTAPNNIYSSEDDFLTTSVSAPDIKSYIYQRKEFDEGMNTYCTPEQIDECCQYPHLILSLLWYNISHLHQQADALDKAMVCLEYAKKLYETHQENICNSTRTCTRRRVQNDPSQLFYFSNSFSSQVELIVIAILQVMGQVLYKQGDLKQAIKKYKASLNISKEVFRNSHQTTASAYNSIGVLYYHLHSNSNNNRVVSENSLALAHTYSELALTTRKDILGANHPDIGTVYNNIGRLYVLKDDFVKALECYEKALHIRKVALGKDSLDYAATAFNAGQSFHQINDRVRALELYHEFLNVAVKHFTKNHRDVAVVLSSIAHIHQDNGEHVQALRLFKESLEAGRNALGSYHPEVAMILNRIGNFHFERGDYDAAFEAYSEGLEIEQEVLENDHGNIIVTLSNLGEIHRQRSEWDEAIKVFKDVLQMQRKRYSKEHPEVATTLHVIGMTYDKKGETDLALSFLQSALIMRRKLHDDNHLDVAFTLSALGTIFARGTRLKLALDLFQESLRVRTALLGVYHCDVAFVLYNIALIYFKQGSFQEAIEGFSRALQVEKYVFGENHKDVSITLYKLGEAYKKNGELEKALKCLKQALAIERRTMIEQDPVTIARTLTEIGNIYLSRGETELMMEAFVEAGRIYQSASLGPENVTVQAHQYPFETVFPETASGA